MPSGIPFEAAVGIAVALVTGFVNRWKTLTGELKYLVVVVLSAAAALVIAGADFTVAEYLRALAVVLSSAVTAHQLGKTATTRRKAKSETLTGD